MTLKNKNKQWWWKTVFVPIIGSGGLITLLVAIVNHGPDKKVKSEGKDSGQTLSIQDNSGVAVQTSGERNQVTVNLPPKPAPKPILPFAETITLRKERDAVSLHGITIKTGFIGQYESGEMFADIVAMQGNQTLASQRANIGDTITVPREGKDRFHITVKEIKLQLPPGKTLTDLNELGILAEQLIKRIVVLVVDGQDEQGSTKTEPSNSVPAEAEKDYSINMPPIPIPIDARTLTKKLQNGVFGSAAIEGDVHTLRVLLDLGISVDTTEEDPVGNTALIWTVQQKKLDAFRFLLDNKADPNVRNHAGNTALDFARTVAKNPEMIRLLEARNAESGKPKQK